ncbi:MAG: hypothetical protein OXR73_25535 [Myxococcales bacterium]|nr:hypothetical protein [Myxococcales bacterium]
MDTRALIDGIVRQTTVLLAQLSTAAGIRAPLSHVADQVFYDLAREIESQGVRQKVVADMFGLALRTYQKKMRRLTASTTERNRTLWEAVVTFIADQGSATRSAIEERFRRDDPADLAAVLKDLVDSGLAYRTGHASGAVYGVTSDKDRQVMDAHGKQRGMVEFVWWAVFRHGPVSRDELSELLPYDDAEIERALAELLASGRAERVEQSAQYRAGVFLLPVDAEQGWEAAVLDHFQAVATAIAAKVNAGAMRASSSDAVGGATLVFDLCEGHPLREEVFGLLSHLRSHVGELWHRVEAHNAKHPIAVERRQRLSFYFGQAPLPEHAELSTGSDDDDDA